MMKDELIEYLKQKVITFGGQKAYAEKIGVSPQYLNDVLHGKREPGPKLLKAMGFTKEAIYFIVEKYGGEDEEAEHG